MMDFNGKHITVMGLGSLGGGVGVIKFLAQKGARLLVTDLKREDELAESLQKLKKYTHITYICGKHREEDFVKRDMIVKNPAVPPDSPYLLKARREGIPIETDISIFLKVSPAQVIGVTGTKGKSTTSGLIHAMLATTYPAFLGSVAGVSPFDFYPQLTANHLVILELSSFELQDLTPHRISPHGAVITNIFPDHLNYHKSFDEYLEAKKTIFKFQKGNDFVVLNRGNTYTPSFASETPGKTYFFNQGEDTKPAVRSLLSSSPLKGEHNKENALAALGVARLYWVPAKNIRKALQEWKGVSYRQELVGEVHGVRFYDDTTATIPEAAIAAFHTLPFPLILIAGGLDKGLDYQEFAKEIKVRKVSFVFLLPGSASLKIKEALKKAAYKATLIKEVASMEEAVSLAFHQAEAGYSVLLSPGAASFNLFKNEFDRGEQFDEAVKKIKAQSLHNESP